jgi:hypothetical protein
MAAAAGRRKRLVDPRPLQPLVDLRGIEAQQVAELDVGDAALGDEPAHVANPNAEPLRHASDVHEVAPRRCFRSCHFDLHAMPQPSLRCGGCAPHKQPSTLHRPRFMMGIAREALWPTPLPMAAFCAASLILAV